MVRTGTVLFAQKTLEKKNMKNRNVRTMLWIPSVVLDLGNHAETWNEEFKGRTQKVEKQLAKKETMKTG